MSDGSPRTSTGACSILGPVRTRTSPSDGASSRVRAASVVVRGVGAVTVLGYLAVQVSLHLAFVLGEAGISVVSRCVSAAGAPAWWATHLAMVRADGACPEGSLALGGAAGDVAVVVATIALPVLFAHVALLVLAGGLVAALRATLRSVRAVAARRLVVHATMPVLVPRGRMRVAPRAHVRRARVRVGGPLPVRRGPPVPAA